MPGQRPQLRVVDAGDVPRQVVRADGRGPMLGEPARAVRRHAGPRLVARAIVPVRAGAGAHEHDVALAQLDALGGCGQLAGRHRMPRLELPSHGRRDVEQDAARDDGRDRVDAQLGEAVGRLHRRVDLHPAEQLQVLRLMAERIHVRPRVLGHDEQGRRARPALQAGLVPAVQMQQHARLVRGERRGARVARLLEVVDAGRGQRGEEVGDAHGVLYDPARGTPSTRVTFARSRDGGWDDRQRRVRARGGSASEDVRPQRHQAAGERR